jgi:hypothetical protein
MKNIIESPDQHYTNQNDWWMIYDNDTKNIIIEPQQCSGYTSSPFTMVVSNDLENIEQYIINNNINLLENL